MMWAVLGAVEDRFIKIDIAIAYLYIKPTARIGAKPGLVMYCCSL